MCQTRAESGLFRTKDRQRILDRGLSHQRLRSWSPLWPGRSRQSRSRGQKSFQDGGSPMWKTSQARVCQNRAESGLFRTKDRQRILDQRSEPSVAPELVASVAGKVQTVEIKGAKKFPGRRQPDVENVPSPGVSKSGRVRAVPDQGQATHPDRDLSHQRLRSRLHSLTDWRKLLISRSRYRFRVGGGPMRKTSQRLICQMWYGSSLFRLRGSQS